MVMPEKKKWHNSKRRDFHGLEKTERCGNKNVYKNCFASSRCRIKTQFMSVRDSSSSKRQEVDTGWGSRELHWVGKEENWADLCRRVLIFLADG